MRVTRVLIAGFDDVKGAADEWEYEGPVPRPGDVIWRDSDETQWYVANAPARHYPGRGYVRVSAERFR